MLRTQRAPVRPPLPDGPRRARRRRARSRRRDARSRCSEAARPAGARGAHAARRSTTSTPACRTACIDCGTRHAASSRAQLGLTGLAGRASGQRARPARATSGCAPYDELAVAHGDARATATSPRASRCASTRSFESLRLMRAIARRPARRATSRARCPTPPEGAVGIGWVEGWRGEVLVALEAGAGGRIRRCHPHDPSWQNWPRARARGASATSFPTSRSSTSRSTCPTRGHDL